MKRVVAAIRSTTGALALWVATGVPASFAQQLQTHMTPEQEKAAAVAEDQANAVISLDIVVHTKNGAIASEMTQAQLTVLDNRKPVTLREFKPMHAGDEPQRVMLVYDAASLPQDDLKLVKRAISEFLNRNGGKLPIATSIGILGPKGLMVSPYTEDGKVLAGLFEKSTATAPHTPDASGGDSGGHGHGGFGGGGGGSSQRTLSSLQRLIGDADAFKGRTAVVWLTQGWPLGYGPDQKLTDAMRLGLLRQAEGFVTAMRRSGLTLYALDPIDNDKFNTDTMDYMAFVKGPKNASEGAPAFLGIQLLAIHSGGTMRVSGDIARAMEDVYAELGMYYRVSFAAEPATRPDMLHTIDLRTPSKDTTARGIDEYWANPPLAAGAAGK